MLDEQAVKKFFLKAQQKELIEWEYFLLETPGEKNFQYREPFFHYHYSIFEGFDKEQNTVNCIGNIVICHNALPVWGMNYDGWYEGDKKINVLGNELLIKALPDDESFGQRTIHGETKDKQLQYQSEIDGRFKLFEIKTLIVSSSDHHPVLRFTYRGRALVNLSS